MAQTAPLVLAPHDSALLAMKHDAVQAPTPRHASRRVRTSSGETFISRSTTYGEDSAPKPGSVAPKRL